MSQSNQTKVIQHELRVAIAFIFRFLQGPVAAVSPFFFRRHERLLPLLLFRERREHGRSPILRVATLHLTPSHSLPLVLQVLQGECPLPRRVPRIGQRQCKPILRSAEAREKCVSYECDGVWRAGQRYPCLRAPLVHHVHPRGPDSYPRGQVERDLTCEMPTQ